MAEDQHSEHALDQRILTCHLELALDPEKLPDAVKDASRFVTERKLWVSINVAGRLDTIDRTRNILKTAGLKMEPVAKVNLGLGRRTA